MDTLTSDNKSVVLNGKDLTIAQVINVARFGAKVELATEDRILMKIEAAHRYIVEAAKLGKTIYGVTTGFGGMAQTLISPEDAAELQENLIWFMKTDSGKKLPIKDVRAAMVIRANTHMLGFSGLRMELIRRMQIFLNEKVTPHVREFGSIGASGDLTPLACITGALIGLDKCFTVDFDGVSMDSLTALEKLGLPQLRLRPKEGLAMINGTSVMSGIAANCVYDSQILLALAVAAHALAIQGLGGTNQSFHPFIHAHKPPPWPTMDCRSNAGAAQRFHPYQGRIKRPAASPPGTIGPGSLLPALSSAVYGTDSGGSGPDIAAGHHRDEFGHRQSLDRLR